MAFAGYELTSSSPRELVVPPHYVFTARSAVLVTGPPCALFVTCVDVHGDEVTRCLGYLSSPWSKSAELRIDLVFGMGEKTAFSVRTAPAKAGAAPAGDAVVHLSGFYNPTGAERESGAATIGFILPRA